MSSLHSTNTRKPKLSLREIKEIAGAVASGLSVTEVAAKFGVSRPTVYRAMTKSNAPIYRGGTAAADRRFSVRMTAAELADFDALAGRKGLSRSEMARRVLRIATDFVEPDEELAAQVEGLRAQLRGIGANLNQIAGHLNREALIHGPTKVGTKTLQNIKEQTAEITKLRAYLENGFGKGVWRRRAKNDDLLRGVKA